jgi:hypothetical protein
LQAVTSSAVPTTISTQLYSVILTTISGSVYNLIYVTATTTTEFSVVEANIQTTTIGYIDTEGKLLFDIVI